MTASLKRPNRTMGSGDRIFWTWCARDELRLPRCTACNRLSWPVVSACEACGGTAFQWDEMSGRGSVASACAFHQDYYRGMLPTPYDTVLVELEEGPLVISNPVNMPWDALAIGRPVVVTFVDAEDDVGPFRLPVFGPAEGPGDMM